MSADNWATCPRCEKPTLDYDQERKRFWCRDIINCGYMGWEAK